MLWLTLTHVMVSLGKGFCGCCQLPVLPPPTFDSWPIIAISDKGQKGFNTAGSYNRSSREVAQGLLQLLELWSASSCEEAQAVWLAWQPRGNSWASVFVWLWALALLLSVHVVPYAVNGKLQELRGNIYGGCRIRKEQDNSKPYNNQVSIVVLLTYYLLLLFVFL